MSEISQKPGGQGLVTPPNGGKVHGALRLLKPLAWHTIEAPKKYYSDGLRVGTWIVFVLYRSVLVFYSSFC